ncbi:C2 domain containing protein [Parasponia andersonii]|uniref:C2 domain containing protein n=1 Tax=Parasponia andersonii TaxID=3476 RepID=A0A2P5BLH6_PARAD|nr:C2 domain containing protein [Parasponia andersonii]
MKKENGEMTHVLEINLISAQRLKPPSSRRMQTYALAWVDSSTKLRTGIDRVGSENPTWNDRFLFRVTPEFLSSETSGVYVEIYAIGRIRDSSIGTVRFLIGNFLDAGSKTPSFTALQIRRPSGRFHGVLNIGAMVISGSDFPALPDDITAIGYRDLMRESFRRRSRKDRSMESWSYSDESRENSRAESEDLSEGDESSTSSSSTGSTVLKDWNGIRDLPVSRGLKATSHCSGGFLCGLLLHRGIRSDPYDQNPRCFGGSQEQER